MSDHIEHTSQALSVFENHESGVRSYCRSYNTLFDRASGCHLYDAEGKSYLDFLSCAGALNYGHNPPAIKEAVINYIESDGIQGALDLHTQAKKEYIEVLEEIVLQPRNMSYKIQFTSPTGTSVVESAVKLARKVTGRRRIVAFTNGYHGMTSTALGLTGSADHRQPVVDTFIDRMPYEKYMNGLDSINFLQKLWQDRSSGYELPAAVIVETVQGEGGINVAGAEWMQRLYQLAQAHKVLLIVDDVQAGCGRTGRFFSFESFDIKPDLICLSKSLSGFGYPLSVLLIKPMLDRWSPGEDNGTFRGNTLAMVAGKAALEQYWQDKQLTRQIQQRYQQLWQGLQRLINQYPGEIIDVRGRGLMIGLEFADTAKAASVTRECFKQHLIMERCGNEDQVIKFLPPLTISEADLERGLTIFTEVVYRTLAYAAIETIA